MANIVFMGTPSFGIPALNYLNTHHTVLAVITQPGKPSGRKKLLKAPPIKEEALKLGLPVFQPEKIKSLEPTLKTMDIDFLITAAYGQIIPKSILNLARVDALNLHGSLLPEYRGAAPIQRAIMAGEKELGVSLMRMVKKMDAGPVYDTLKIPNHDFTSGEAFDKLSQLSVELLKDNLDKIMNGLSPAPQDESKATYAKMLTKEDELLSFDMDAKTFYQHYLALKPEPLGMMTLNGVSMKLAQCTYIPGENADYPIVKAAGKKALTLGLKGGDIAIQRVKPLGKNEMSMGDFLNGKPKDFLTPGMKV